MLKGDSHLIYVLPSFMQAVTVVRHGKIYSGFNPQLGLSLVIWPLFPSVQSCQWIMASTG